MLRAFDDIDMNRGAVFGFVSMAALAIMFHYLAWWGYGVLFSILLWSFVMQSLYRAVTKDPPTAVDINWPLHLFSLFLVVVVMFSLLTAQLSSIGIARFGEEGSVPFHVAAWYFGWVALDVLPGLAIPSTLELTPPLRSPNLVAALVTLTFRVFLTLGVLEVLARWWALRNRLLRA